MVTDPDEMLEPIPPPSEEPLLAHDSDRDAAKRALDELFVLARQYNTTESYFELLQFIARFRFYSPFNAMLIHTQKKGAKYVATAYKWLRDFRRIISAGAQPIVILQPMGPVLFVFDVSETEPLPDAPALPRRVHDPFGIISGAIDHELELTIRNAKRDGIRISERAHGSQRAGSIQEAPGTSYLDVMGRGSAIYHQVPIRYELLLNSNLSEGARYATLVHELGHLYCGHLGTPDVRWWPDRQKLSLGLVEFEAESVCYLVCTRLGLQNPSAEYLAAYVRRSETTPPISLDAVLKASWLIEQMGRKTLPLRKGGSDPALA